MLIQNRIDYIDVSENIDLGRHLRHFLEMFENCATTWDLRFNEKSPEVKVRRSSLLTR